LLIRDRALVVNLESVRLIITADTVSEATTSGPAQRSEAGIHPVLLVA
jgi:hypothetical protein